MPSREAAALDVETLVTMLSRRLDDALTVMDQALEGHASLAELHEALRVIRRVVPRLLPAPSEDELRASTAVPHPNTADDASRQAAPDPDARDDGGSVPARGQPPEGARTPHPRTSKPRGKSGRPRAVSSADVRAVFEAMVREGVTEFTISQLAGEIVARCRCSRKTAYRSMRRARAEGALRLPAF